MNPFDLRGPEFLLFYLVLAVLVVVCAAILRRMKEAGPAPKMDLDPYGIAYLRGGKNETIRVAIVSLIDRGLLTASGTKVQRAPQASAAAVRHSIEKALLQKCAAPCEAADLFKGSSLKTVCRPYEVALAEHELLPGPSAKAARWSVFLPAVALLIGVGGIKILVALSRGRTNVGFLAVLTIIATFLAVRVCFPRITTRGKAMLRDLQALYSGLKVRAASIKPGGATIDAVMLAAVFGLTQLPARGFGYAQTLFPQAKDSGSGCGSSCGSSCGGCGGGCGGCGS